MADGRDQIAVKCFRFVFPEAVGNPEGVETFKSVPGFVLKAGDAVFFETDRAEAAELFFRFFSHRGETDGVGIEQSRHFFQQEGVVFRHDAGIGQKDDVLFLKMFPGGEHAARPFEVGRVEVGDGHLDARKHFPDIIRDIFLAGTDDRADADFPRKTRGIGADMLQGEVDETLSRKDFKEFLGAGQPETGTLSGRGQNDRETHNSSDGSVYSVSFPESTEEKIVEFSIRLHYNITGVQTSKMESGRIRPEEKTMRLDWELASRMECSDPEKEQAWKCMDKILDLAELSRKEGLLALDDQVEGIASPILREGVRLILDGYDPEMVNSIMERLILLSPARGADLLTRVVEAEGVLLIQQGMSQYGMIHCLSSFFGETYGLRKAREMEEMLQQSLSSSCSDDYAPLSPETSLLEDVVPALTEAQINSWVSEIDTSDLTMALKGAGSSTVHRILGVLTERSRAVILEDLTACGPVKISDIVAAQKKILQILKKLEGN